MSACSIRCPSSPPSRAIWRSSATSLTVGELESCITAAAGKPCGRSNLFDIYRGVGIEPGKKSVAFSLELRADDRTLTDEDSVGVVNKVLESSKPSCTSSSAEPFRYSFPAFSL